MKLTKKRGMHTTLPGRPKDGADYLLLRGVRVTNLRPVLSPVFQLSRACDVTNLLKVDLIKCEHPINGRSMNELQGWISYIQPKLNHEFLERDSSRRIESNKLIAYWSHSEKRERDHRHTQVTIFRGRSGLGLLIEFLGLWMCSDWTYELTLISQSQNLRCKSFSPSKVLHWNHFYMHNLLRIKPGEEWKTAFRTLHLITLHE